MKRFFKDAIEKLFDNGPEDYRFLFPTAEDSLWLLLEQRNFQEAPKIEKGKEVFVEAIPEIARKSPNSKWIVILPRRWFCALRVEVSFQDPDKIRRLIPMTLSDRIGGAPDEWKAGWKIASPHPRHGGIQLLAAKTNQITSLENAFSPAVVVAFLPETFALNFFQLKPGAFHVSLPGRQLRILSDKDGVPIFSEEIKETDIPKKATSSPKGQETDLWPELKVLSSKFGVPQIPFETKTLNYDEIVEVREFLSFLRERSKDLQDTWNLSDYPKKIASKVRALRWICTCAIISMVVFLIPLCFWLRARALETKRGGIWKSMAKEFQNCFPSERLIIDPLLQIKTKNEALQKKFSLSKSEPLRVPYEVMNPLFHGVLNRAHLRALRCTRDGIWVQGTAISFAEIDLLKSVYSSTLPVEGVQIVETSMTEAAQNVPGRVKFTLVARWK